MSHWNWTKREMSGTCRGGHATGASPGDRVASLTTRCPGVPLQNEELVYVTCGNAPSCRRSSERRIPEDQLTPNRPI